MSFADLHVDVEIESCCDGDGDDADTVRPQYERHLTTIPKVFPGEGFIPPEVVIVDAIAYCKEDVGEQLNKKAPATNLNGVLNAAWAWAAVVNAEDHPDGYCWQCKQINQREEKLSEREKVQQDDESYYYRPPYCEVDLY